MYHHHCLSYLLVLFTAAALCCWQLVSAGGALDHVRDVKQLKQLLRTTPNLLCVFVVGASQSATVPSGVEVRQVLRVVSQASQQVRGVASLVTVDCSSDEGRKVCKKQRVSPEPVTLRHYHNGAFNRDYDRSLSVPSLVRFLLDPTGETPWQEEASARHVRHLDNEHELSRLLRRQSRALVLFYVPQCGYCKQLKPIYSQLAEQLQQSHVLAAVDLSHPAARPLSLKYNITAYPTIHYFLDAKLEYTYSGGNDRQSLMAFIENPDQGAPPAQTEPAWSSESSAVNHLTDTSFDQFISEHVSVLVMFYAPWCGHCKVLKPKYVAAAERLAEQSEHQAVLAAVDATTEKMLASRFKVQGFPTLKYFGNGSEQFDVNLRETDAIVSFMLNPQRPEPAAASAEAQSADTFWSHFAEPLPDTGSDTQSKQQQQQQQQHVRRLESTTFRDILRRKKHALVMFFAPWCGHCRRAAPEFAAAARHWSDESRVMFAAVDCTEEAALCSSHGVSGYPTLRYFSYHSTSRPYRGGRTRDDFIAFMRDPESSEGRDQVEEAPPSPPPEQEWAGLIGANSLHHLTDQSFDSFSHSRHHLLVMFYAPWCGHCKQMKPAYAAAASQLATLDNVALATVDATQQLALKNKFDITGYPTLKYFSNGRFVQDYDGGRSKESLVQFMTGLTVRRDEL